MPDSDRPTASFDGSEGIPPTASFAGEPGSVELPVEQAVELDRLCNEFEAAWRTEIRPRLEDAVAALSGALRAAAVKELVALDVYYRRQKGEVPTAEEYAVRFPELAPESLAGVVAAVDPNAQTATGSGATTPDTSFALTGERFGPYELLGEIARGGMGIVHKARQVSLDRIVALKVVKSGEFADPDEVRRFRAEAEAAATLDHPNIVSIFEVGEFRGVQYYAMRLVEGGSLAAGMGRWSVPRAFTRAESRQRQIAVAGLMASVARAVHHAHQRGILHRDLKPGNILLDESGGPHVTDFGLARRIGKDSTLTRTGAILGTPSYMAPEQARGREDVTTEADVYGLGAVLYELLAGRPPFAGVDVLDTLYQVREREPDSPRSHCPFVDRDLETVCLKCLEKDPNKRYSSAAALADDLDRWRGGEPILARRAGTAERVVKWCRRHPAGAGMVALGAVAAGAIIWGLVALSYNAELAEGKRKVEVANGQLQIEKDESDRQRGIAEENRRLADEQRKVADEQRKRAAEQEALARRFLYVTQMNQAQRAYEEKKFGHALSLLDKVRPERPDQEDLRGPEWHHLWRLCGGSHIDLRGHTAGITCAIYSSDGLMLASGDSSGVVKLWDIETQRERRTLTGPTAAVNAVAFDAKGKRVAAASDDRTVRVWDVETGRELSRFTGHGDAVSSLAFHPSANRIVSGGRDGSVVLWEAGSGTVIHRLLKQGQSVRSVAVTANGFTVAAATDDGVVRTWSADTGAVERVGNKGSRVTSIRLSPDGGFVLIGRHVGGGVGRPPTASLELRTVLDNREVRQWPIGPEMVTAVGLSEDGIRLAAITTGASIVVLSRGGEEIKRFQDTSPGVLAIEPGGGSLATAGRERTVCIRPLRAEVLLRGGRNSVAFSGDGGRVVAMGGNSVWDPRTGQELGRVPLAARQSNGYEVDRLAISLDGRYVSNGVQLLDLSTGTLSGLPRSGTTQNYCHGVSFASDGRSLAAGDYPNRGVTVYDIDPPKVRVVLKKPTGVRGSRATCVRYSPDGRTLAVGFGNGDHGWDTGEVQLWDIPTGALRLTIDRRYYGVWDLAFTPDGRYLAGACGNYYPGGRSGEVQIWDTDSGREVAILGGYPECVWGVSFSPDGNRLATASGAHMLRKPHETGQVRIWDWRAGQEVFSELQDATPLAVAYSPDGKRLAVVREDKTGRIWGPP